jgi:hypothetical protein
MAAGRSTEKEAVVIMTSERILFILWVGNNSLSQLAARRGSSFDPLVLVILKSISRSSSCCKA